MEALLLAAGLGTRLRPLTDTIPKCLVPIGGKPLLGHWFDIMQLLAITKITVNSHYLSGIVASYVEKQHSEINIRLVYEANLLGTAGTLFHQGKEMNRGEDVLFAHADNFCQCDWKAFIKAHNHRPPNCVMTMMLFETPAPSTCGIVELDKENVVQRFHEKVEYPPSNLANGAIYLLAPDFWRVSDELGLSQHFDFSTEIIPELTGRIYTWKNSGVHIDVGTPETYQLAKNLAEYNRL